MEDQNIEQLKDKCSELLTFIAMCILFVYPIPKPIPFCFYNLAKMFKCPYKSLDLNFCDKSLAN